MSKRSSITGIILAAGRGSRYFKINKQCKLTAPFDADKRVIQAAFLNLETVVDELIVVTGHWRAEVNHALSFYKNRYREVFCPDYDKGMGASLKAAIEQSHPTGGWLVTLADLPSIAPVTHQSVASALKKGAVITRPFYQNIPGHPVGFSHQLKEDLLALPSAQGANSLIKQFHNQLIRINTDDRGVIYDIDKPSDLASFPIRI